MSDCFCFWNPQTKVLNLCHICAARGTSMMTPKRGKDLVCWCPLDQPCHADVLLEIANR